jgi:hypothetical protein
LRSLETFTKTPNYYEKNRFLCQTQRIAHFPDPCNKEGKGMGERKHPIGRLPESELHCNRIPILGSDISWIYKRKLNPKMDMIKKKKRMYACKHCGKKWIEHYLAELCFKVDMRNLGKLKINEYGNTKVR